MGHQRIEVDAAVADGLLAKKKVGGWWVYACDQERFLLAEELFSESAEQLVSDWFVSNPLIAGKAAAKAIESVSIGPGASDALMRSLVAAGRFGWLPVFNQSYLPYLAVYAHERAAEVFGQISAVGNHLDLKGEVARSDLEDPVPAPTIKAWRQLLLSHADYLSMGYLDEEVLTAWSES